MSIRFRQGLTIIPGLLRLNFSRTGVSLSFGPCGASLSLGQRGLRGNVGLPGTGLSYSTKIPVPQPRRGGPQP